MNRILFVVVSLAFLVSVRAAEIYCRFATDLGPAYGEVVDDMIHVLDGAPWEGGATTGATVPLPGATLLAPSEPRTILGIAGAYASPESNPPKTVRWFAKSASGAAANGEAVPLPASLDAVLVEVEMVIVIGRTIKDATPEEAEQAIFGYTCGTEIFGSVESHHRVNDEDPAREETLLAPGLKLGDKFAPFGPFIHRGVEWRGRARTLEVRDAEGELRHEYQHSTDGLLYPPAKIVSDLSRVQTLEPGDVIFSGTSAAFTAFAGDTVVTEVEGLGRLQNTIVALPQ